MIVSIPLVLMSNEHFSWLECFEYGRQLVGKGSDLHSFLVGLISLVLGLYVGLRVCHLTAHPS
jgi:hypothetical protein